MALSMAAETPKTGLMNASVAPMTAPREEMRDPSAVGAFSVAAMTIAAPRDEVTNVDRFSSALESALTYCCLGGWHRRNHDSATSSK